MPSGQSDGTIIINTTINTDGMNQGRDDLLKAMNSLSRTINKLTRTIKEAFADMRTDQAVSEIENVTDAAEAAENQMESLGESAQSATDAAGNLKDSTESAGEAAADAAEQYDRLDEAIHQAMENSSDISPDIDDSEESRTVPIDNPDAYGYNQEAIDYIDRYVNGTEEAETKTNEWKQALDETKAKLKELQEQGFWYGDDEFDEMIIKLNELNNKVKEYAATLKEAAKEDVPQPEIDTSTMEGQIEAMKRLLQMLKEEGKGFGNEEYDNAYRSLKQYEKELADYKKELGSFPEPEPEIDTSTMEGQIEALKRKLEELRVAGKGFGDAEYDSTYIDLQNAMKELNDYKNSLTSASEKQGFFSSMLSKTKGALSKMASGVKAAAGTLRSFKKDSKDAGASGNIFTKSLSNIFKIAKTMLVRNAINAVFSGAKEGMQNLVQYSDSTNYAISSLMSSLTGLKNSFAAAFAPVLSVVCPILSTLINYLMAAANAIAAFFAALTGKGTFVKAKKVQQDYAKSLGGTSSAAQDASDSLDDTKESAEELEETGIDEFNVLGDKDSNSGSGGSGAGGGGGAGGIGDMFETETVSSEMSDLANKVRQYFKDIFKPIKDAWDVYGETVIQTWKQALKDVIALGIDIAETFRAVWTDGTGFEFVSSILRFVIMIGKAVDALAVSFKDAWDDNNTGYNYLKSILLLFTSIIDVVTEIGNSLVDVWSNGTGAAILGNILQILTNIHMFVANIANRFREAWEKAGTGTKIIQGLLDIVNDFLGHINNITAAFREWAEKIDFSPLLTSIDGIVQAVKPLANKIGAGLEAFFKNVLLPLAKWAIEQGIPAVLDAISAAFGALNAILDALKPVGTWIWENILKPLGSWTGGTIVDIISGITEVFRGLTEIFTMISDGTDWGTIGQYLWEGLINGITSAASWVWEKVKEIFSGIVDTVKSLFGINSPSTVFAEIGGFLVEGLLQGIEGLWQSVVDFFSGALDNLKQGFSDAWDKIRTTTSNTWSKIKTTCSSAWSNVKSGASQGWSNLKSGFSSGWSNLKSTVSNGWSNTKNLFSSGWSNVKSGASSSWSNLKSAFSSGWSNLKSGTSSGWSNVKSAFSSGWSNLKSGASSGWSSIKSSFSTGWSNLKSSTSSGWSNLRSSFSSGVSNIRSAFSNVNWSNIGSNIMNGIYNGISSGWRWLSNTVSNMASSLLRSAKNALGIHSPSKKFEDEFGENIPLGAAEGVSNTSKKAVAAVENMANDMQDAAGEPIEITATSSIGEQALSAVRGFFEQLAEEMQNGMDSISEKMGSLNAAISKMQHIEFPQIYQGTVVPVRAGKFSETGTGGGGGTPDYPAMKRIMKEAFAEAMASKGNGKCYLTVNIDGREWFSKWLELYNMEKDSTGKDPIFGI